MKGIWNGEDSEAEIERQEEVNHGIIFVYEILTKKEIEF